MSLKVAELAKLRFKIAVKHGIHTLGYDIARKSAGGDESPAADRHCDAQANLAQSIYQRYQTFTMIPRDDFTTNLRLCMTLAPADGCVVECGVWRGGMSAALADVLPNRTCYLFDSFEGLPPAREIDGAAALEWQSQVDGPSYHDNCRAERSFAEAAMAQSAARDYHLVQGWFSETLTGFRFAEPIAVLRLDGDWYDSTMQCLDALYPQVMLGGLIVVDDYHTWDGCTRAVHDYLSRNQLCERISQADGRVCFIQKRCP